jgi:hypothetical protein
MISTEVELHGIPYILPLRERTPVDHLVHPVKPVTVIVSISFNWNTYASMREMMEDCSCKRDAKVKISAFTSAPSTKTEAFPDELMWMSP